MNQPNIPGKARLTISIPATQPNPSSTRSRIKNVIPGKILTGYCNSLLTSGVIRPLTKNGMVGTKVKKVASIEHKRQL
jgi:hypothetical protein